MQSSFKCVPILLPTRKLYCFAGLSSFHSVLYSEKIRKEFNIDRHKKNNQLELYRAVAAHGKILLKTLSQNTTISYPIVASQAVWLFIRLKKTKETEEKNKDGITIQELTEKIRQMDQEEFIVTVSLEGGLADGRE